MAGCLLSAVAGGAYLSYYVVTRGMTLNRALTGRIYGAIFLCVILPLVCLLAADRAGSATSKSDAKSDQTQLAKKPIAVDPGALIGVHAGNEMATNAESFDMGHEHGVGTIGTIQNEVHAIARAVGADSNGSTTAMRGAQSSARKNPLVVQTGDGAWEVKFHMPGAPRIVETNFPLPLGKVYYISTNGLVENLKIGKVSVEGIGNNRAMKRFNFSPAPASEFCGAKPHMLRGITDAPNARLAFSTELVPPGDYTIKVLEPLMAPAGGDHSPGVPLDRWYQ